MRERKKEKDIGDEVKVCIYRGTKKVIREERETKGRECRKWHCRLHLALRKEEVVACTCLPTTHNDVISFTLNLSNALVLLLSLLKLVAPRQVSSHS